MPRDPRGHLCVDWHVPDLASLDGEQATCVRCGATCIGTGPYEVVDAAAHPSDGNKHVAHLPTAAYRVVDHRTAVVVAFAPQRAMATRIAALLNFAHEEP